MSKRARSPVLGYNHNLRYGGRVFHVQTEDSGTSYARLYTHLFFEGTILSSKKQEYDPEVSEDTVRALMQKLHKTMIKELMRGEHSARIGAFFMARGEPAFLEPPAVAPAVAARPKAGGHIAVREGGTFVAGKRARAASATEAQPHQPLASAREIRMPWETPAPRRVAQPAAAVASAPVAEVSRPTNGKIRMPWDPPGGTTEAVVSDKSLDEVILEYLADDSE